MAVHQLGVIGCGLMGGSFALALKSAGEVGRVVGFSRSEQTTRQARAMGAIDVAATALAQAVRGCDLVLLAVPVAATERTLREIAPHLEPDALLMDVGSTKSDVEAAARRALGDRLAQFVPAHPIAGKEHSGIEHADATLYRGRLAILTPLPENPPALVARATRTWQAVGSVVRTLDPAGHDRAYAAVSHLPHLLAFAYFSAVASQPDGPLLLSLAGPGFRDFTRIAAGDPVVWRDIFTSNRDAVLAQLAAFQASLSALERALRDDDARTLEERIGAAARGRAGWRLQTDEAASPPPPEAPT